MLRFLWRFVAFLAEMNGYTPFFQALFKANLAIIVGGLSRSEWVGMLRFRHSILCKYNITKDCYVTADVIYAGQGKWKVIKIRQ